jgi:hypothetical protein
MTSTTPDHGRRTDVRAGVVGRTLKGLPRRWPTVAAIALTALVARDLSTGADLTPILAASGLVYLGAAALKKPTTAWPVFLGTFVVITAASVASTASAATWILLGLAVPLAGYGLLRGAARPTHGLPLQAIAMAGFGGAAAITLLVGGDLGAYLVAAGLLGHAAWDVWHHRTNRVVARSLAEFCVVLDTLLAVVMVVVAVWG